MFRIALTLSLLVITCKGFATETSPWKAGAAAVAITPEKPMWMAGYAARNKPSEGKIHDLFAKALAIEDAQGTRLVIVTTDLIGIPRPLRDWLEEEVARRYDLPPAGLLLNASHTHCGPELRASKASLYGLDPIAFVRARLISRSSSKSWLRSSALHSRICSLLESATRMAAQASR